MLPSKSNYYIFLIFGSFISWKKSNREIFLLFPVSLRFITNVLQNSQKEKGIIKIPCRQEKNERKGLPIFHLQTANKQF